MELNLCELLITGNYSMRKRDQLTKENLRVEKKTNLIFSFGLIQDFKGHLDNSKISTKKSTLTEQNIHESHNTL